MPVFENQNKPTSKQMFQTRSSSPTIPKIVPISEMMPPCSCRVAKGLEKGWCCQAGGGVPACDH